MGLSPLAGKPAPEELLIKVPELMTSHYPGKIDFLEHTTVNGETVRRC